jgi:hypothetical protein
VTDPSGAAIQPAAPDDLEQIVQLNNQAVPAVSGRRGADGELVASPPLRGWSTMATADLGFVLLEPGSVYDSANYRWFASGSTRSCTSTAPWSLPVSAAADWGRPCTKQSRRRPAVVDLVESWPRST